MNVEPEHELQALDNCDISNNPLGDTIATHTGEPTPYYIAFTCSADPQLKCGSRQFHELSPVEQKRIYYLTLKKIFKKYHKVYGFNKMMIHYELDKSLKIHCHGYVDCKESILGYDVPKLQIMSDIHKDIGRKGNRKNVSTLIKWIDGKKNKIEEWKKYCSKENSLKPSKIINHSILDFL